jgi:hypothetical protein
MHERETTDEAIYICDNDDDLGGFCLDSNQDICVSKQLSGSSKIKVYPLTNFTDDTKTTKERNANAIEGSESDGAAAGPPTKVLEKPNSNTNINIKNTQNDISIVPSVLDATDTEATSTNRNEVTASRHSIEMNHGGRNTVVDDMDNTKLSDDVVVPIDTTDEVNYLIKNDSVTSGHVDTSSLDSNTTANSILNVKLVTGSLTRGNL